jgi:hypothetical protein
MADRRTDVPRGRIKVFDTQWRCMALLRTSTPPAVLTRPLAGLPIRARQRSVPYG